MSRASARARELGGWAGYLARTAVVLARRPREALDRFENRRDLRSDVRQGHHVYEATPDWRAALRERIGVDAGMPGHESLLAIEAIEKEFAASEATAALVGHDADPAFLEAVWCAAHDRRPARIVETGVARGLTTRAILSACRENDFHLWSIDLPPILEPNSTRYARNVARAAGDRWTYLRGASRRLLPRLLPRIQPIDLFIHDSSHTYRNTLFELTCAWSALAADGILLADDVDTSSALRDFESRFRPSEVIVGEHASKGGQFAVVFK